MLELVATLTIIGAISAGASVFAWQEHLGELFWVFLAVLGGLTRSLDGYVKSGVFPRLGILAAHIGISGFAGFMMAQLLLKIAPGWEHIGAGVGGYLGTQGIDWIAQAIRARLGGEINK